LESGCAIAGVSRPILKYREHFVRDRLQRFVDWQYACSLTALLFDRTAARNPLSDEALLLFVKRELRGAPLLIPFLASA